MAAIEATKDRPKDEQLSLYSVAKRLKLSPNYLARLVHADCTSKPNRKLAIELEDMLDVPVRSWDEDAGDQAPRAAKSGSGDTEASKGSAA